MTSSGSIIGHSFILQMPLLLLLLVPTNVFAMNRTAGLMRLFVSHYKIVGSNILAFYERSALLGGTNRGG